MTPVQTQRRQADPCPVTVIDGMDGSGPRVRDDMTVEVALSVMAGARVDHLLLCDADDQCTGSVTRAELAVHRGSATYTDRTRLRDVLGGPFASPVPRLATLGEHDRTPGVLALSS
ncbi:CBS domain-containing protein [Streptomyces afghaniensis]|uniref:CBS domain-containing protein n=1 Tax=Streptomyces afghaniensis TaxID=66865 RepID=UPI0037B11B22